MHTFLLTDFTGETAACAALGVEKGADLPAVKKAYRRLALESHPDKVGGAGEAERQAAEARFREVQEAYETLVALHGKRGKKGKQRRRGRRRSEERED